MRVGMIGLGYMGAAIAAELLQACHELTVFDTRSEALESLAQQGLYEIATDAGEASAGNDIVIIMLPGPAEVRAAVLDQVSGVLSAEPKPEILVDCSTNSYSCIREIAAACTDLGIGFLDAPVTGYPPTMTTFIGGERKVLETARPILQAVSGELIHMGPNGLGCVTKLINQLVMYGNYLVAVEGLVLANKLGMDPELLARTLQKGNAGSVMLGRSVESTVTRELETNRRAPVSLLAKDMRIVAEFASEVGVASSVSVALNDIFQAAVDAGYGDVFDGAITRVVEKRSGVGRLRNE